MSTTVKQSFYKEVKGMYKRKNAEVIEVSSMVSEAENKVDIPYEMHTEINERLNDLIPDLLKLKENLAFIVYSTNTTDKEKVKYVEDEYIEFYNYNRYQEKLKRP